MALNVNPQVLIDKISKMSDADKLKLSEAIFKEHIQTSDIKKFHPIDTGVNNGDPISYIDKGNRWDYMQDASGLASKCDYNSSNQTLSITAGEWQLGRYNDSSTYCYGDVELLVKDFLNSNTFEDNDDEGTVYRALLLEMVGIGLLNSHWVKTYFNASTLTHAALKGHDGLFTQMLAIAPAGSDQRVSISENAGATYVDQKLAYGKGFEVFNEMNTKAENSERLRNLPLKETSIRTTRALAQNYLEYLRKEKQVDCCEKDSTQAIYSLDALNIYGRPIEVVDEWDSIISFFTEFNDGTSKVAPHRAIIGYKENERIGTGEADRLNNIDVKYNDYEEETKVKTKYTFGVEIVDEERFILAM